MDVLCELYPVEMTAIFASKRIFAAAATGGARTAELPTKELVSKLDGHKPHPPTWFSTSCMLKHY